MLQNSKYQTIKLIHTNDKIHFLNRKYEQSGVNMELIYIRISTEV